MWGVLFYSQERDVAVKRASELESQLVAANSKASAAESAAAAAAAKAAAAESALAAANAKAVNSSKVHPFSSVTE